MSLIENASRRLEELKRAGVHIPDGLAGPDTTRQGPVTTVPADESAPSTLEVAATRAAETHKFHSEHPVQVVPERNRAVRASRNVALDLATLAAEGYVTPEDPRSPIAQEFRLIKRPLIANVQGKSGIRPDRANLLMVTSAVAGEGKSYCALNLAMSLAMEQDSTVLLVDADVASPSLMTKLRLKDSRGLLDLLTDPGLDLSQVLLRTNVGKLSLLPAGTRHERATELLASEGMARLVQEMSNRYPDRIVVFDSPPLLYTTESPALASHMGQIVMVVEAERTSVASAKQALAAIEQCPIVMTVLNKASAPAGGAYYGYGYEYGQRGAR